jgi:hypothetical protein
MSLPALPVSYALFEGVLLWRSEYLGSAATIAAASLHCQVTFACETIVFHAGKYTTPDKNGFQEGRKGEKRCSQDGLSTQGTQRGRKRLFDDILAQLLDTLAVGVFRLLAS